MIGVVRKHESPTNMIVRMINLIILTLVLLYGFQRNILMLLHAKSDVSLNETLFPFTKYFEICIDILTGHENKVTLP